MKSVLDFWLSWLKNFLRSFWQDICRTNQLFDFFGKVTRTAVSYDKFMVKSLELNKNNTDS